MSRRKKITPLPPSALETVERWCIGKVPEADQDRRSLIARSIDSTITIFESHMPSSAEEEAIAVAARSGDENVIPILIEAPEGSPTEFWTFRPVIQLAYNPEADPLHAWYLFYANLDDPWEGEWNLYGGGFSGTLQAILDKIDEDPDGTFKWIDQLR
ncbi:hypothetical protein ACQPXH_24050 [Nocardia sp. CA-135953]|uniref:hypothetical protein n=1 Tax=Nocardia sp. CA-135953 TaxID=3239978 RepID=UPI003D95D0FD